MLFLRTFDTINIQGHNEMISFDTHNRKWNDVIKVYLNDKFQLDYVVEELMAKMIPQSETDIFRVRPIYMIVTDFNTLVFQDPNNICNFLVLDENDLIVPTNFVNLTEDDEILIYNNDLQDYIIAGIRELMVIENDIKILNKLSDYIIYSEKGGLIINDFIIMGSC